MASTIYDAVGGLPALVRLAHAWHERSLSDPVVAHAFSHGYHPDHTRRLAAYWAEALGGPALYTASVTTESHVVRLHSGNGEHREMDERAVACFESALDDVGLDAEPDLREALVRYFTWATAYMATYHGSADEVPDGLTVPKWSWDGLVGGTDSRPGRPQPQ
ncbi:group II truncated hemoglobin [Terrabacter aerolatus]|uniref:Oxidoreductase n=1 Tax=Terrabacter aerolatus TaxID=422442 RepID=A0A512D5T1_9MICO|nr:group II truncated hemoglobin [Terrabacter aerolatus]GEO31825.1 oxidoreductase [Terrabacter aerolatus]